MNLRTLALVACAAALGDARAAQTYTLDLDVPVPPVRRGQLDLGGRSVTGHEVTVNNRYIELDGRPFVPVVGEFHFSRYPAAHWDEAIRQMQAGGINVIATYVFWNMHERQEGVFDWSGDRDLRRFLELCARHHVWAMVRMGPFCHGEIRNGGIPDWIYGRPVEIRSNDPGYLAYADRLYGEIARQMQGMLFKDGGPVIGVQLENEYQHSAAPWEITYPGAVREFTVADRDVDVTFIQITANEKRNPYAGEGRDHMATLKRLARRHGIDVPLYTATGWGNAAIVDHGSIPVTAGYPYPFWAPRATSRFYLYRDLRREPDYAPVSFNPDDYPSIPAELGGGISITYARRPIVPPESLPPLIVRTLGSGSNGIGYYMYHGGSNPVIDGHFFHEQSGGLNRINYDYQAPIGEFGQMRLHHRSLRLLHLFLQSFGAPLAPLPTILPPHTAALAPDDVTQLRYAVRADGDRGFVFMHNFQDQVATPDLTGLRLHFTHPRGALEIPRRGTFTLRSGTSAILPFNLDLAGHLLRSATVQPLTELRAPDGVHHVFVAFDGLPSELVFAGNLPFNAEGADVTHEDGLTMVRGPSDQAFRFHAGDRHYLVLPYARALTAFRPDETRLFFSDADLFAGAAGVELRTIGTPHADLLVYPATAVEPRSNRGALTRLPTTDAGMTGWRITFESLKPTVTVTRSGPRRMILSLRDGLQGASDLWVRVPYLGDRALAFIGGELVADHFCQGLPWDIGLRKFESRLAHEDLVFVFHPLLRNATYLVDLPVDQRPTFADGRDSYLRIDDFEIRPEYRAIVTLAN